MFCPNCGNQIESAGRFCEHCGASIAVGSIQNVPPTQDNSYYQPVTSQTVKKSGAGVLKGCLIAAGIFVLVVIVACIGLYHFSDDFREGFDEGYNEEVNSNERNGFGLFNSQVKYSNLSSAKQEKLMDSLYERLDEYFLGVLQDDEQLMQLLLIGALGNENEGIQEKMLEKKFGDKIIALLEEWSDENNVDVEDFGNSIDEDEFAAGYFLHLMEVFISTQNE
jgi:hypothetical protein